MSSNTWKRPHPAYCYVLPGSSLRLQCNKNPLNWAENVKQKDLETITASTISEVLIPTSPPHTPQNFPLETTFSTMRCTRAQSCPTLCVLVDCSPPGPSVHETLQARILKWVAISSSKGQLRCRDQTQSPASPGLQMDSLLLSHLGRPLPLRFQEIKNSLSQEMTKHYESS